jgi:hypothetical protein
MLDALKAIVIEFELIKLIRCKGYVFGVSTGDDDLSLKMRN